MKRLLLLRTKRLLLCFILFLAFFAYRVHFWGDISVHGWHAFVNAVADTIFSVACGSLLFYLNARNAFIHRWIFPFSVLFIAVFSFALYRIHYWVCHAFSVIGPEFEPMFNSLCFQLLDSAAIIITGALVYMLYNFSGEKKRMQEVLKQLAHDKDRAELNYLRSKIEPHFIFNGLNGIYHEIDLQNAGARSSLQQFSDIMRYHLQYASCEKVNFGIELQYLQSYINFQFKRFSDFLTLEQKFNVEDPETEIEPLLILPFVENAFKFCSASGKIKGNISFVLEFSSKLLKLDLINTYDPEFRSRQLRNGFGLDNVLRRLSLLYPGRFTLDLNDRRDQNLFQCHLEIAI